MPSFDIITLNTKARRNLRPADLQNLYSQEELYVLLGRSPDPSDIWEGYGELLRLRARNKKPRLRRRWSPIEDKFLLDTYNHLPDSSIALALNIPRTEVSRHRLSLKLNKRPEADHGVFVVWHHRDDFNVDMDEQDLNKIRGDGIHPLLCD